MRKYYASDILPLSTLCTGQCCDLKVETRTQRVWLCRVGGGVTIESLRAGRWIVTSGGCTALHASGQ